MTTNGRPIGRHPLRHDRLQVDAVEEHADRAGVEDLVVDREPVLSGSRAGRREPADHLEVWRVEREAAEERVDREAERIGQGEHRRRAPADLGPADDRQTVGRLLDSERGRGEDGVGQRRGEHRDRGRVLHLSATADDRDDRRTDETGGREDLADRADDVSEGAAEVGRGEAHDEVGVLAVELLEHRSGDLAHGLRGDRVLGQRRREGGHEQR